MKITEIAFSAYPVTDLAPARAFYEGVLGLTPHLAPLELMPGQCERWRNLYLKTDEGIFDCLGEVLGIGGYSQVFARSEITATSFGNFRVLDIPSLIEAKVAIGRPHDLRTAVQLRCVLDAKLQPPQ